MAVASAHAGLNPGAGEHVLDLATGNSIGARKLGGRADVGVAGEEETERAPLEPEFVRS